MNNLHLKKPTPSYQRSQKQDDGVTTMKKLGGGSSSKQSKPIAQNAQQ